MTLDEIYMEVSNTLGFDVKAVKKAYGIYWKEIRKLLVNMNLNELKRDYHNSKPGVRINGLGTLYIPKTVVNPWKRNPNETDTYIQKRKYKHLKRKTEND